ncbi:unnamed protein product, partial [marine sediment metagenome]
FCIAKKYKTFYLPKQDSIKKWKNTKVEITDEELLSAWKELGNCYYKWDGIMSPHMCVEYEDLISNPTKILIECLNYLNIDFNNSIIHKAINNSKTTRMTKPVNQLYIERLKQLNPM